MLAHSLAGFLQMRLQDAKFREVEPPQEDIGKPRWNILRIERTRQAEPHGLLQLRIKLVGLCQLGTCLRMRKACRKPRQDFACTGLTGTLGLPAIRPPAR